MGRVAAIGESVRVQGLSLAGVLVLPGEDAGRGADQLGGPARRTWRSSS